LPESIADAIRGFKEDVNPVAEFCRTLVEKNLGSKVERSNMLCAFQGWWKEEAGDDVRLHGTKGFKPKLLDLCPWIKEKKIMGQRYYCGIRLNDEGLVFWKKQHEAAAFHNAKGTKGSCSKSEEVNEPWSPRNDQQAETHATDAPESVEEFKV
jgi:hypothetical protein